MKISKFKIIIYYLVVVCFFVNSSGVVYARRIRDENLVPNKNQSADILKIHDAIDENFEDPDIRKVLKEEIVNLIEKGPYKMNTGEVIQLIDDVTVAENFIQSVSLCFSTLKKENSWGRGTLRSVFMKDFFIWTLFSVSIFGIYMSFENKPVNPVSFTIPYVSGLLGIFFAGVKKLNNNAYVSSTGDVSFFLQDSDFVFKARFIHEVIHWVKREDFIERDIPNAYVYLRIAELIGPEGFNKFDSSFLSRKEYFEEGRKLIKLSDPPDKNQREAEKFKKGVHEERNYHTVLGGMAYELGVQTGDMDNAWEYLNLISNGVSLADAERIVRGKEK